MSKLTTEPCTIIMYKKNAKPTNVTTGDLTTVEILDHLKSLMHGFSKILRDAAIEACGTDDPKVLEEYLDEQCRLERLSGDDLINDL
jgi:hypothetical protein